MVLSVDFCLGGICSEEVRGAFNDCRLQSERSGRSRGQEEGRKAK